MSERVPAQNKTSATPSQATQASSPLLRRPLTSEISESVGSNSNISKELGGIQPKTIRRRLNWENITVEAPSRGNGMSLPGGIQRQQEEKEETPEIQAQFAADSAQKSALESSNSTISTSEPAQKPLIARAPFNGRNISVEAPQSSAASSTYPGGSQRLETSGVKEQEKSTESVRQKKERLEAAVNEVQQLMTAPGATVQSVKEKLPDIQSKYELKSLYLVKEKKGVYHVHGEVNPTLDGPPGVLFTAEELQELEAVAQNFSVQINQKEKEKPGTKAKFLADPLGFIRAGRVDKSGDVVEAAGGPGIEQLAAAGGLTVVKNPYIQFVDAAGKHIGGRGPELDFLILGLSGLTEIVSAKLKPGDYKPKRDRKLLNHFVNMPLTPPDIIIYAQTNFGNNKAYANIAGAKVISNLGEESLSSFRANYLNKVVVDTITVTSLTPGPEASQGLQLRVSEPQLLTKVVELMRKYL